MSLQEQYLQWIPEGAWEKRLHKPLGADISLLQGLVGDETAEEVMEEVRLHYGKAFQPALTAQPVIRVEMVSSGQKTIKPLSAVLRWLRGSQRDVLGEWDEDSGTLPLYLEYITPAPGESYYGSLHSLSACWPRAGTG